MLFLGKDKGEGMSDEKGSKKGKIGDGDPHVVKTRGDKKGGEKRKKTCPLRYAKRFAQAFLKLDAWCESTRGQKRGKVKPRLKEKFLVKVFTEGKKVVRR